MKYRHTAQMAWGALATTSLVAAVGTAPRIEPRAFVVGERIDFDFAALPAVRRLGAANLTVHVRPGGDGLIVAGSRMRGTPTAAGLRTATVAGNSSTGAPFTIRIPIVIFAAALPAPVLPDSLLPYSDLRVAIPRHFLSDVTGSAIAEDNQLAADPVTDAGATLGRVLFYDTRLSANDRIACASCHRQQFGFADTARYSRGVRGVPTTRHVMALANARYYRSGRFFRDERAATLEAQTLQPIANPVEMGLSLDAMLIKLRLTSYYAPLFKAAFGTTQITSERVAHALAQFIRSLVSNRARFDSLFRGGGPPDLSLLTPEERIGRELFNGTAGCSRCHRTSALELDLPDNIGLDSVGGDSGAGGGKFKTASLRNIAIRPPYMHDGRFKTLDEVVAFYDSGIRPHPNLDPRLRAPDGGPQRLHLNAEQRHALVAYLETFTDQVFLHDARFGDPFAKR